MEFSIVIDPTISVWISHRYRTVFTDRGCLVRSDRYGSVLRNLFGYQWKRELEPNRSTVPICRGVLHEISDKMGAGPLSGLVCSQAGREVDLAGTDSAGEVDDFERGSESGEIVRDFGRCLPGFDGPRLARRRVSLRGGQSAAADGRR